MPILTRLKLTKLNGTLVLVTRLKNNLRYKFKNKNPSVQYHKVCKKLKVYRTVRKYRIFAVVTMMVCLMGSKKITEYSSSAC